jgi:hypothetical protein
VPYFGELAAKTVFDEVKTNATFHMYLPDLDLLKRPPNRQYLFNVSVSPLTSPSRS